MKARSAFSWEILTVSLSAAGQRRLQVPSTQLYSQAEPAESASDCLKYIEVPRQSVSTVLIGNFKGSDTHTHTAFFLYLPR